jgi:hypothetical protein
LFLVLVLVLCAGCGPTVDLATSLQVQDSSTGWFDLGIVNGQNKLVPSITFSLKNNSNQKLTTLQVNALFRRVSEKDEWGSGFLTAAGSSGLVPEAATPLTIRSQLGYTGSERSREDAAEQPFCRRQCRAVREIWIRTVEAHRPVPLTRQLLTVTAVNLPIRHRSIAPGPLDASAIVISNVIGVGIFDSGVVTRWCRARQPCSRSGRSAAHWRSPVGIRRAQGARKPNTYPRESWQPRRLPDRVDVLRGGFSGAIASGRSRSRVIWIDSSRAPETRPSWQGGTPVRCRRFGAGARRHCHHRHPGLVQVRGVRPGRLLQNSLTTVTVGALVAFVVAGLIVADAPEAAAVVTHQPPANRWLTAMVR